MKILAAIAASELADKVIDQAVRIAAGCGAELTILSVGEIFKDAQEFLGEGAAQVEEKLLERAKGAVHRARERAKAGGVFPAVVVETGRSPEENIVDFARENGMDMIVIGHRERSGLSQYFVGSVASRVVAQAPCSVLVVRSGEGADLSSCATGVAAGAV